MHFEIVGEIEQVETIAVGGRIRDNVRLRKQFGEGKWRKLKGAAMIRLKTGQLRRAELPWYEAHGIGRKKNEDPAAVELNKMAKGEVEFALCVKNDDCDDLELRKIYRLIQDEEAAKDGYLRVVDESGEDYLYPESYFIVVKLPLEVQNALAATS